MSFYLDNSKVQKLLNLNITKSQVKRFCKKNLFFEPKLSKMMVSPHGVELWTY